MTCFSYFFGTNIAICCLLVLYGTLSFKRDLQFSGIVQQAIISDSRELNVLKYLAVLEAFRKHSPHSKKSGFFHFPNLIPKILHVYQSFRYTRLKPENRKKVNANKTKFSLSAFLLYVMFISWIGDTYRSTITG